MPLPFRLPFQSDPLREALCFELAQSMRSAARARALARASEPSGSDRLATRRAQNERMRQTHADLLSDPRSAAAARFFLEEIYGATVPTWRDEQALKALPALARFLPAAALEPMALAMRLDDLTEELDARLASAARAGQALGPLELGELPYKEAYQAIEASKRQEQFELVERVCQGLARASALPLMSQALASMRLPAKALGLSELQGFLERGLGAFSALESPQAFADGLLSKEKRRSRELYG